MKHPDRVCICGDSHKLTPDDNIVIRKHGTREFYDGVAELPKDPEGINPFVEMAKEMYSGWQVDPIWPRKELHWRSIMKPEVIPLIWYGAGSLCFLVGTIVSILRAL